MSKNSWMAKEDVVCMLLWLFSGPVMSDSLRPHGLQPGLSVPHHLPELAQVHVHRISDAVQPSHPLPPPSVLALPFSSCPQSFPASCASPVSQLLASGAQSTEASASASVLPMNIQGWSPLGLTGLISLLSRGLSRVSPAPQFESINSSALILLYGPALTCDYWKKQTFECVDLCQQSDVFAF